MKLLRFSAGLVVLCMLVMSASALDIRPTIGTRLLRVRRVSVNVTTLGNNTIVAAVTGAKLRLLAAFLSAQGGANSVKFQDGAGGTDLSGLVDLAADEEMTLPEAQSGWAETSAGTLLNLNLSAATAVTGAVIVAEIPTGVD